MHRYSLAWFLSPSLLLCLMTLWCAEAYPQASGGSVIGQILVVPGNFLPSPVLVSLEGRGAVVGSVYTDGEGHFTFNQLPGNIYHIVINEREYQPVNEQVVVDPDSAPMRLVNIYLTPKPDEKPKPSSSVTGGNPNLTNSSEYTKAIPKAALKEYDKGVKSDQEGKAAQAIEHYEKALHLHPDFYAARNNLGSDYMSASKFAEAQEQFETVLKINPSDAQAYFNMGNLHLLSKNYEDAQHWVDQGLSRQPDSAFGHFLQGSIYARLGALGKAEAALHKCLELDPMMAKAHLALVNLYLQQQRTDEAVSELKVFVKSFPGEPLAAHAKELIGKLGGGAAAASSPER